MVCLFVDGIDEKMRQNAVLGKLGENVAAQIFFLDDQADHDIIFTECGNRVRTVGVDQKYLVLLKGNGSAVDHLGTGPGIDIIDFYIGMNVFRYRIEPGIPFDCDMGLRGWETGAVLGHGVRKVIRIIRIRPASGSWG